VDSETANAPMMEASSSAMANSTPAIRPACACRPAARSAALVKPPPWPANAAAVKPMIAPAPRTTTTMPIHRSAFSNRMNRGVIRLSIT
jgi:hypothetical protein